MEIKIFEIHSHHVFGGVDDQISELAAVSSNFLGQFIRTVVDGDKVEGTMCSTVEKVKVSELKPQPLLGLSWKASDLALFIGFFINKIEQSSIF